MTTFRLVAWTRRQMGLAAGGVAAALLARMQGESEARRKRRRRKKRCKKMGVGCAPGGRRRCCRGLVCDEVAGKNGARCCKAVLAPCAEGDLCCGNLVCIKGQCVD